MKQAPNSLPFGQIIDLGQKLLFRRRWVIGSWIFGRGSNPDSTLLLLFGTNKQSLEILPREEPSREGEFSTPNYQPGAPSLISWWRIYSTRNYQGVNVALFTINISGTRPGSGQNSRHNVNRGAAKQTCNHRWIQTSLHILKFILEDDVFEIFISFYNWFFYFILYDFAEFKILSMKNNIFLYC